MSGPKRIQLSRAKPVLPRGQAGTCDRVLKHKITHVPHVEGSLLAARPVAVTLLFQILVSAAATVELWVQRARQRRQLARLNQYQLKDIGLSRADAEGEASRPFWRP
jgi:uncharacterized protein YjiS (DUF1127 family)